MKPVIYDDEDNEIALPVKWAICSTCRGNGKHSLRFGAITQSDRDNDWDADSWDDYMSGAYDARCDDCDGDGKVQVADRSQMTPEQIKAWDEQLEDEREYQAEREAELRFGC